MFVPIVNYAVALTIKLNFRLNCIGVMTPSSVVAVTGLAGCLEGNDDCVKKKYPHL